jgi:4-oxalocrotonate tautomerase family enzyme
MPIIEAHLLEGYGDEVKSRLGRALTDAVVQVIPASPEAITVLIHELAPSAYMRGGENRSPAPARPDPVAMVRDFLAAMEARDLERARGFLAPGFTMHFPAAAPMHTLEELIAWARPRYRFVKKTYDGFEVASCGAAVVVYARGTLSGEWPDGTGFADIRFIDRFEIEGGRFTRQEVWNDIAETQAQASTQQKGPDA